MLLDLVFWQVREFGGWQIEQLPVEVLFNVWDGFRLRKYQEINALNHSAAMTVGAAQTKEGEKIRYDKWLPYNLEDVEKPIASPDTIAELIKIRDELPYRMLRDLYQQKIINPLL